MKTLQKLYYDLPLPTSFASVDKLKLKYKGKENIQEWLNKHNFIHYMPQIGTNLHDVQLMSVI